MLGKINEPVCQGREILRLHGKTAKWITGQTVESCGNEHQVGRETDCRLLYRVAELTHVAIAGKAGRQRNIPYRAMWTTIGGSACAGIPGPLVHRDKTDRRLGLDQGLCAVPVMHIPVDDKNPIRAMPRTSVVRAERHAAKETETHAAIAERVVSGRSNRAEAARVRTGEREVDSLEHRSRRRARRVPGSFGCYGISIELTAARCYEPLNCIDIGWIVDEGEFFDGRVARCVLNDAIEHVRAFA